MIRSPLLRILFAASLVSAGLATGVSAKEETPRSKASKAAEAKTKGKTEAKGKPDAKADAKGKADPKAAAGKPTPVGTYGDWDAFVSQGTKGKDKTCYALAKPKERTPKGLKRDDAFLFITNRPDSNVRNEIAIVMGYAVKDGAPAKAEIGSTGFDLVAKGTNVWIKNPAEENQFVDAIRKGSKLTIKASSQKGNVTTDSYSLAGISDALARVQKDCP